MTVAVRCHHPPPGLARTLLAPLAVLTWAALALQGACGSRQDPTFASAEPPEPASARLFMNGVDVTSHVGLNSGAPQEIEVRLHAANGAHISGYDDHFDVTIEVEPAQLATASAVEVRPLFKLLTPTGPEHEPGALRVVVRHSHTLVVRTFGPFDFLIH